MCPKALHVVFSTLEYFHPRCPEVILEKLLSIICTDDSFFRTSPWWTFLRGTPGSRWLDGSTGGLSAVSGRDWRTDRRRLGEGDPQPLAGGASWPARQPSLPASLVSGIVPWCPCAWAAPGRPLHPVSTSTHGTSQGFGAVAASGLCLGSAHQLGHLLLWTFILRLPHSAPRPSRELGNRVHQPLGPFGGQMHAVVRPPSGRLGVQGGGPKRQRPHWRLLGRG